MQKYKILRIDEPDFGCECAPEDQPLRDKVLLSDERGEYKVITVEDALLYELNLNEGDFLLLDEERKIHPIK